MVLGGRMGAKGVRVKNRPFAEGYKKTGLDGSVFILKGAQAITALL